MTGIILAGGRSSRMGQDKALMNVGGVPVFKRILNVFEDIFDEILIITNKEGRFAGYGYPE
ncbi:MAG TPA: molybdenum cofactor guanylyltransferase, partial [Nitrospiraceae bacterium]|nr:molybdenum cofactor guanylyltransferase [Nitrospiraceae bacterium]